MAARLDAVRDARPDEAIAGVPARYVAEPASTGEVADLLRAAAAQDLAVVVRGAGTRQDWGAPPSRLDLILDTRRLAGVVEHAAGDLIVVVRAGTPMAELRQALAPAGQQLALDSGGSVGGTVAVAASGPRRMLYGTARDLLIGVTIVRADGVVAKAGGKVVKNVAGYDLGKLVTGSYGTLGVITECAFRLHPLPAASAVVSRRVDSPEEAGRVVAALRAGQVVPSAVEVDAPAGGGIEVAVLIEGVPDGVAGRVEATRKLVGGERTGLPDWWARYPWQPGAVGVKLTGALSRVPALLAAAREAGASVRGSAGVGVLYAGAEPGAVDALRAAAHAAGGHAVVLTAPEGLAVDRWGPVEGLELMRRVKAQFDPDGRLAPGRFLGRI
jgi:glycolate oxidase FAD binding subunit